MACGAGTFLFDIEPGFHGRNEALTLSSKTFIVLLEKAFKERSGNFGGEQAGCDEG
jgi:hypothetical protein